MSNENDLPKNITDEAVALTDLDIKNWCNKNNLNFNVIDLANLEKNDNYFTFVFTGSSANHFNNGNSHHWLFCVENKYVFDSYGKRDYIIPKNFEFLPHKPEQLQHYDTNVCGEYCCLLYHDIKQHNNSLTNAQKLGQDFVNNLQLGTDQINNDEKVLRLWTLLNK